MTAGRTRHNSRDNATTQIKRKSIRHVSWPPLPANIVNHIFPTKGIPNDSIKSKSALDPFLNGECFRIGTLYEYTNQEKYELGTYDANEGAVNISDSSGVMELNKGLA